MGIKMRGHSSMVEPLPSKLRTRVRFSPVAPIRSWLNWIEQRISTPQVAGSRPAERAKVKLAAQAYRASKRGVSIEQIGDSYTADVGHMRAALKAIGVI